MKKRRGGRVTLYTNINNNKTGHQKNTPVGVIIYFVNLFLELKEKFTLGSVYSTSGSGASKQLKQIIQTEHNIVKNANWSEANQLAIYVLFCFCFFQVYWCKSLSK